MEQPEESIFHEALALETAEDREEFLAVACAGRPELLTSVRSLLDAYSRNAFLDDTMLPEEFAQSIASANSKRMDATVGPYHILRQIGHGGMGSVYMAEQLHPVRRMVAIKVIRSGLDSSDVVRRFHQEQRTLAMMDHPNIARVLDASITESGVSYFVMELVNGIPILAFCEKHPRDVEQRLRLFIDCCQAIQHAHQKGIIHRDIKPSNVLVTLQDGQPVVKVIDFGIAKAFATDNPEPMRSGNTFATQFGEFLGTPQYMSPEQAALDGVPLDTRTDIYSLGALLYAILTGGPPFDSTRLRQATFDEIRQIVREEDPLRPSVQVRVRSRAQDTAGNSGLSSTRRRLSQRLSGDLDCIVMKALEKDRERRYSTVNDLAEDIRSFLDNKPIHARAPTAIYTLRKLTQRHRSLVLGSASAMLCLLIGATMALVQANRATVLAGLAAVQADRAIKAEGVATQERDAAIEARKSMAETLYASNLRLASAATVNKDSVTANAALQRNVSKPGVTDQRSFDWHFLAACNRINAQELFKSDEAIYSLCRIAGRSQTACCGMDGKIWILDELTGKLLHTIQANQGEVNGLASSPDGTILASAGDDGTIAFWDTTTGESKGRFPAHKRQAFQIAWSVDGQQMATCGNEPGVRIWKVSDYSLLCEISSGGHDLEYLTISANDDLAFGAEGGIVTLTKMPTTAGQVPQLRTITDGTLEHCSALAFSPDGQFLVAGRINGKVIYEAVDLGLSNLREEFLLSDSVNSLCFSVDGKSIGVGTGDGAVSLLHVRSGKENGYRLTVHSAITDLAGNPLDGDANGTPGESWHSDSVANFAITGARQSPDENSDSINSVTAVNESTEDFVGKGQDDRPFVLLRSVPAFVGGMLPMETRTVTLVFSEPAANAHDLRNYEFHRDRNSAFISDDGFVIPDSATVDGSVVTLTLPESGAGLITGSAAHTRIQSWPQHQGSVACVLFSQDGQSVLSVGADGRCLRVYTERTAAVELIASHVEQCEFGSEGRLLIRHGINNSVYYALDGHHESLTNTEPGTMWITQIAKNTGTVYAAVPDETCNTAIRRWSHNLQKSDVVWTAAADERAGKHAVSPDEQFLAVETVKFRDGQYAEQFEMTIWDLKRKKEVSRHACRTSWSLDISPDGRTVAYANADGVVLFEPQSGRILQRLPLASFTGMAFSPDSQELAAVSDDRMLRIWRIEDGVELHCIQVHGVSAKNVAYAPDGKTLGTVGMDGLFRCWRRDVMQMTMEIPFSTPLILLRFSPDGKTAAILDGQHRVFLLTTGSL